MVEEDRALLLGRLVIAPEVSEADVQALRAKGIVFEDCLFVLVSLETRTNFFDKAGDKTKRLLKELLTIPFEYVNLTPGSTILLLREESAPDENQLRRSFNAFRQRMHTEAGADISVVVTSAFHSLTLVPEKMLEVDRVRLHLYYGAEEVLFTERLFNMREHSSVSTEHILQRINAAIESRDLEEAKRQVQALTGSLEKQDALSIVYTHYLFWAVANRLYHQFAAMNDPDMKKEVHALLRCENLERLGCLMEKVLDELETRPVTHTLDPEAALASALEIIAREYGTDLSPGLLARRVSVPATYLSYLFRRRFGNSIIHYLTTFRMSQARRMTEEGMTEAEICQACGYGSLSYFQFLCSLYLTK